MMTQAFNQYYDNFQMSGHWLKACVNVMRSNDTSSSTPLCKKAYHSTNLYQTDCLPAHDGYKNNYNVDRVVFAMQSWSLRRRRHAISMQ